MALDLNEIQRKMKEFYESEEGEKFFQDMANKIEKQSIQTAKADKILSAIDYDARYNLIKRIADKHDDRWIDLCYKNGYQPYPWNIVYPLFQAAEQFGTNFEEGPLDDFDAHFGAYTFIYNGFYFNWIHGQGTVLRIFDKNKEEIFRS